MTVVFVLLMLGLGAAGYWYLRRRGAGSAAGRAVSAKPAPAAEGLAVPRRPGRMVNPGQECCAAVRRIESAWYPESSAPRLPLDACQHPQTCKCTWMQVLDRRTTYRRVDHDRRALVRFEDKTDRRAAPDRRADSVNPWKNT